MLSTRRLSPADLPDAARILRAGDLVAFPTETVYGLGADATQDRAVAEIYAAKARPSFNPLIVHVASLSQADRFAILSDSARRLADAFWPGPLTLVLPLRAPSAVSRLVTAGLDTIAIRVPGADIARALLSEVGRPIAAPSANPSGRISPTTADHVLSGLDGKIHAVLDGGAATIGLESTIVSAAPNPRLLRLGAVQQDAIEDVLGAPVAITSEDTITAPGQLASHYAPWARVTLNVVQPMSGMAHLGFGPGPATFNLSETADLVEAAANLFGHLHRLDALGQPISVSPIPDEGLGRAINDRLRRAAAPRDSSGGR